VTAARGQVLQRTRLQPDERRAQILAAAAQIVVEQGYMPLSLDLLAKRVGVSKALIYTYLPTQHVLAAALVRRYLPQAADAELRALAGALDFSAAAGACAEAYFHHVARIGPLLHILMSDLFCRGHLEPDMLELRARVFGRLARRVRQAIGLNARRSLAVVRMFAALVEEAGTLAYRGQAAEPVARRLCLELVAGGLAELQETCGG
jgi:AcrR family transcriptional regulator